MGGLDKTSQRGRAIWTGFGNSLAQRAQASFELGALDGVGGERDRALVGACGARGVARAAEQRGVRGVRGVQRLVALERRIGEQRLEQLQARGMS